MLHATTAAAMSRPVLRLKFIHCSNHVEKREASSCQNHFEVPHVCIMYVVHYISKNVRCLCEVSKMP